MTVHSAPIRVLIVDDSAVIRGALGRIIDAEPDLVVATTAPNGRVALDALRHTPVDVVLLDVEMPEMDGITALPRILAGFPSTRVIMASSLTQGGAEVTLQALALGAADYITKPAARSGSAALAAMQADIVAKVRAIGRGVRGRAPKAVVGAHGGAAAPRAGASPVSSGTPPAALLAARGGASSPRVVAIASSTGGPNALAEVLGHLPRDFPLPILITQHMPAVFTGLLAQRLERDTHRPCAEAADGMPILPGHTYVAPGGFHMVVRTEEAKPYLQLTLTDPENFCRPSADPMFRSVAAVYGASALAVVLTGMGDDGMRGARAITERGGRVLVQDEATSVVWGMPGAVANAGLASAILPLPEIAEAIQASCGALV
jgi:two-component system chemotaxis response regulator CheB